MATSVPACILVTHTPGPLTGLPPFYCRDRERLFEKIRRADLTYPKYLSGEAKGVLTGLLTRDPQQRLGTGPADAAELKAHPFFRGIDFVDMLQRKSQAPWHGVCDSSRPRLLQARQMLGRKSQSKALAKKVTNTQDSIVIELTLRSVDPHIEQ